jgi:hypothetical protein
MKPLTLNRMGNSFDPTNVAQLFNTYFTEIAGKLQSNFEAEAIKHKGSKLNLSTSIFLTPTDDGRNNICYQGTQKQKIQWIRWDF